MFGLVLREMKNAFAISYADLRDAISSGSPCALAVHLPANRCAGHRSNDSRFQTTEVALVTFPLVDDSGRLDKAGNSSQLGVVRISSCLQQRLDHV